MFAANAGKVRTPPVSRWFGLAPAANERFDWLHRSIAGCGWMSPLGRSQRLIPLRRTSAKTCVFSAEHWKHIRTINPIESTFAAVRHRPGKTKGCLSRKTGIAMAFKLMMSAQKKWQKRNGANRIPELIQGIAFIDGVKQIQTAA